MEVASQFQKGQATVALIRFAARIDDTYRWREAGIITEFEFELYTLLALDRLKKRLEALGL